MRTRIVGFVALALLLGSAALAGPANANNDTKVVLQYDCGPKSPEGPCATAANRNTAGPEVGFVNYNQNGNGDLIIVVAIKRADPNTTYDFSFYCGNTHNTAGNRAKHVTAAVTTNGVGNGNTGAIKVTAEELAAECSIFNPTPGQGHVDMDAPMAAPPVAETTLAATPIRYTLVP